MKIKVMHWMALSKDEQMRMLEIAVDQNWMLISKNNPAAKTGLS